MTTDKNIATDNAANIRAELARLKSIDASFEAIRDCRRSLELAEHHTRRSYDN